jgi:hypothetical protein
MRRRGARRRSSLQLFTSLFHSPDEQDRTYTPAELAASMAAAAAGSGRSALELEMNTTRNRRG